MNSFTFGLLDGFAKSRRPHRFVIFANAGNRHLFEGYRAKDNFQIIQIEEGRRELVKKGFGRIPKQLRWLKRVLPSRSISTVLSGDAERNLEEHAELLYVPYCPPPIFPFPDRPTVYSIHDLQHFHYPEFFSEDERKERDIAFANCTNHAALIQASSEQMRDDFLAHFPVLTPEKVVVIQEGVNIDSFRTRQPGADMHRKYGLPPEFMYFPAQLWHHKNHITVFKAIDRLKARGLSMPLVLSGARYEGSERLFEFITEQGLGDRIFYLGLIPFEDVVALHQAAKFLITAVLYESSSIPILEAAAAGTPVIASQTPANIERSRDLQLNLFPPKDDVALAGLLEAVWNDQGLISAQVEHNSRAIQKFDWPDIAEDYLDAFEKFMAGQPQKL